MRRYSCTSFLFVSLFAFAVVTFADNEECGLINADQFSNSEKITQIDEFPWIARMLYNSTQYDETIVRCLAVLISQRHLLTTAHCLDYNEDPYAVLLGDWNTSNDFSEKDCDDITGKCFTPLRIEIDEIITYPFYSKLRKIHDIAMIRLTQTITLSDHIRPICLPSKDIRDREFGSEQLTVTGWLLRDDGQKRKSSVFIYNHNDCRRKYGNQLNLTDSHICGMAIDKKGLYFSGSALLDIKDNEKEPRSVYLLGIKAYGQRKISQAYPDVYIRVDQYLDWIKENMY